MTTQPTRTQPSLARHLTLGGAVGIGLGAMIGAGVFTAFAPAARAAGTGLLLGLVVAALVAYCNAAASAQLAAASPTSGGTYVYGRERLGEWWGFVAGWGFVVGKTASCAAMALALGAYVAPDGWERPVAVAGVVGLAAVGYRGITRTARLAAGIVCVVLASLAVAVAAAVTAAADGSGPEGDGPGIDWTGLLDGGWYGTLQAAGLLFFAFAGYARIATLGEEVRDPARTIPRAILLALGVVVVVYAIVGTSLLHALGPDALAASGAPVAQVVDDAGWSWAGPVVRVGAAAAAAGALLALLAGVGRTALAMARNGDLPRWLAAVHPEHRVPHHAELAQAVAVCVLVLTVDLRTSIGFSSFGVLVYYLVANLAALRQPAAERRFPRALQVLGAAGCAVLVVTLPLPSVAVGAAVLAAGVGGRLVVSRLRAGRTPEDEGAR